MDTKNTFRHEDELQTGSALVGDSERDFAELGGSSLYRLADLAGEFGAGYIAANARSIAERVFEGRFYVACVGQFKRGKSTLLNALIEHPLLPAGVIPVTTVPTVIRYGKDLRARVRFENTNWTGIALAEVEDYVSEEKNSENRKAVVALEIFVPSPLLVTGMCLVDTPGLGSVHAGNAAATHAFIPHIDAAIVVIGTDPPLSGEELQLVENVAHEIRDLIFVLNKADRSTDEERFSAIAFARRVLEAKLQRTVPTIFEVSAVERLKHYADKRDWENLLRALWNLVQHSGRSLVREATERGLRRNVNQLLKLIQEERSALQRPVEESERRIATLRQTIDQAGFAVKDLGHMLSGEQQRLSDTFVVRRTVFMKQARVDARREFAARIPTLRRLRNGPGYRRDATHMAQAIAQTQLAPWLEGESRSADEAFRKATQRFVELGDDFLRRLAETGIPELGHWPVQLTSEGLRRKSDFHFNLIERVAAPASPLLYVADLVRGAIGLRSGIVRDAMEFLDQLLEVNSARVQSDVDERVRESQRQLQSEIKSLLGEVVLMAERTLDRARKTQAAGAPAVEAALGRLDNLEYEVLGLLQPPRSDGNEGMSGGSSV